MRKANTDEAMYLGKRGIYWRVTFVAAGGKHRSVWAANYNDPGAGGCIRFYVVDKTGEFGDPKEVVFCAPVDVVNLRVAVMNNKYAELEIA